MLRLVTKKKLLTVKVSPDLLRDFAVAAKLRGATMSALVHMYAVRVVKEEKLENPKAFIEAEERARPTFTVRLKRPRTKERRAK